MNHLLRSALCFLLLCQVARGQHYDDRDYGDDRYEYQQEDNMYTDYANRQAEKAAGGGGGFLNGKTIAFGIGTWFLGGKIHSGRATKKLKAKHKKEQKDLYVQYLKDVGALQNHIAELEAYVSTVSKGQLDAEFHAADVNADNKVSRAEFNMYKQNYLASHPEMASQFPKFEDFDPDHNGMISKAEYDAYYQTLMR